MIFEIAQLNIKPGMENEFELGVSQAIPLFKNAKGYLGLELRRVIETPGLYHLMVQWNTLENHTIDFRNSENFQKWRGLVGHCFASPPVVVHTANVVTGF